LAWPLATALNQLTLVERNKVMITVFAATWLTTVFAAMITMAANDQTPKG
jgi:hypothetical protein